MAHFQIDADRAVFGVNEYLRSTDPRPSTESYTFSKDGIPTETIDGAAVKVLQPGTVLAKITSGPEAGKVGVYDTTATDGREVTANIVGVSDTFLPWQLNRRDVNVAAVYDAVCVLAWCFQYTAGVRAVLTQAVADDMRNTTNLDVKFV